MFIALCVSQTGALFSADSWHDVTFVAGEVRNPKRNLPLALGLGTSLVAGLYMLCNLCYLAVLPLQAIQNAPGDRVATLVVATILPTFGKLAMAILIMVSTFGTVNALTLAGARACYAMAQDGLFFSRAGRLNKKSVPAWALGMQCLWSLFLVLPRTYDPATGHYGNLYSNLLDYVISAALLFYIFTVAALSASAARGRTRRGLTGAGDIHGCRPSTSPARRSCSRSCSAIARQPPGLVC